MTSSNAVSTSPTNMDIFNYFIDKNNYTLSTYYFNQEYRRANGFEKMFRDFSNPQLSECDLDNKSVYQILNALRKQTTDGPIEIWGRHTPTGSIAEDPCVVESYFEIQERLSNYFDKFDSTKSIYNHNSNLDLLNPQNNIGELANQKWHLYIGVLAWNAICRIQKDETWVWLDFGQNTYQFWNRSFDPNGIRTQLLRIWIIENISNSHFQHDYVLPIYSEINRLHELENSNISSAESIRSHIQYNILKTHEKLFGPTLGQLKYGLVNIAYNNLMSDWERHTTAI